ncbi:MAG: transporter substrate-binding domain-containing protein [Actinomycetota bacterium]
MKIMLKFLAISFAFMLIATGCAKKTEKPPVGKEKIEAAAVSIDECVTSPDQKVSPAAAKGVDFKTQLKTAGKLTFGSDIAFPPFESVNPSTNEAEGFDIDLGKEIAKRLGLEAEFINAGFDALFTQSLPQGQFDVAISAITVKAERQGSVDFTVPYFKADLSLAAATKDGLTNIEDLKGKLIGAQSGTTGEDCAKVIKDQVGATEVRSFETALQAFDDLGAGRVAGVINDLPSSKQILKERPALEIVQTIDTKEVYAIAIGKQKPDLRVAINKAMKEIFSDGTFANIYKKWFAVEPPFPLPPADFPN